MTGSPYSNVLSGQTSDTTSETAVASSDTPTEPAPGVEVSPTGVTHESGQDETPGDSLTGTPTFGT